MFNNIQNHPKIISTSLQKRVRSTASFFRVFLISMFFLPCTLSALTTSGTTNSSLVRNGLIGHWTFDGKNMTSSTARDISGNSLTGTLASTTAASASRAGKIGQGFLFDGVDASINFGSATTESTSYTVSFWVNKTSSSGGTLFMRGDSNQCFYNPSITINSTGVVVAESGCSATGAIGTATTSNGWHLITITRSGQTVNVYVDTTRMITDGTQPSPLGTSLGRITAGAGYGNTSGYVNFGNSAIDDLRLYNRALSITEIQALYGAGIGVTHVVSPTAGLRGHWTFDSVNMTTSTSNDSSTNKKNGTLVNMTSSSLVVGKLAQALSFDGINDHVIIPSLGGSTFANTTFTLSGWFKTSSSGLQALFVQDHCNGGFEVRLSSGRLYTYLRNSGACGIDSANRASASSGLADNRWHHFAVVITTNTTVAASNTISIYVDGVLDQGALSQPAVYGSGSETWLTIGARYSGADHLFAGNLDDMRYYNKGLTAKEISNLYVAGRDSLSSVKQAKPISNNSVGFNAGLIGHWTFDGKNMTNATATDISGNGYNGALNGMTQASSKVIGKIGQALSFDGVNAYVSHPGGFLVKSVAYWVKPTSNKYSMTITNPSSGFQNYFLNNGLYSGTTTATRYINGVVPTGETLGGELVTDGTAESGGTVNWNSYFESANGAAGTEAVTSSSPYAGTYSFDINITNSGSSANTDVQFGLVNNDFSLTSGTLYKAQFATKSTANISGASVNIALSGAPYTTASVDYAYNITSSWTLHTFYFYSLASGTNNHKINFKFGNSNTGHVYYDNISVKPVTSVGDVTNNKWNFVVVNLSQPVMSSNIKFGRTGWSTYFTGTLDEVRLYDRTLSDVEVRSLYKLSTQ